MTEIPAGFAPHPRRSPVTDPWGPIWYRQDARAWVLGITIADAHCNSRGLLHGGVIAALADNAMGLSVVVCSDTPVSPVTVALNVDYFGMAKIGQWVTFETQFVHVGGSLATTTLLVLADGVAVAKAGATFRLGR